MKLHIGSVEKIDGWSTYDIGNGADFKGDFRDLGIFADNSIDEIYASHVLEHQPQAHVSTTLKEWRRVLVPGGQVMISVPDLDTLCRLFIHPSLNFEARSALTRVIYGAQFNIYDFHLVGFTFEILSQYLREASFFEIEQVKDFGICKDSSVLTVAGFPISVNVKAVRC
jgi:predicted SAM-dependent methyltransferase